ncbi:endonuclease/exonuclease/phosphatase family protein [Calothrix sp. 336/3]|uniref:endonuclease/exonuclease/phosphatase family protein n=1 Tax=Calothrix sp. 336/3 TaxID=1337936 RepID=UPI001EE10FA5|nr:endonuclease/exonuclease/phosphatase family protein [Calothrix sp. 336/3]
MIQKVTLILATTTILSLGLFSLASYQAWSWPLELIAHFRYQYFILSLITSCILFLLCKKRYLQNRMILIIALLIFGLNAIDIIPWYLPHSQKNNVNTVEKIRVLSFNINPQNTHLQKITNFVKNAQPDVALLIEVSQDIGNSLNSQLKKSLPYYFRSTGGGLVILSRLPIKDIKGDNFSGQGNHNLIATLDVNGQDVKFIGTHPLVPIKRSTFDRRNLQLNALSNYISTLNQPLIVAGDFNLTPWSPYYRQFIRRTKLHNTSLGFGLLPSWPRATTYNKFTQWITPLLNIPIDHCFVNQYLQVANIYTGNNYNSDHAPIVVDLVLRS